MGTYHDSLEKVRLEIDGIDESIHDLLIRRSELVEEVRRVKVNGGPFFRPGREAQVLRRLVDRHKGSFPKPVMVRIWREIFGAFIRMQGPFAVAAYAHEAGSPLDGLARDHFGSLTPTTAYPTELGVLRAVNDGKASVGVLPLPDGDSRNPWWPYLERSSGTAPRIVARLPFAVPGTPNSTPEALVVALGDWEASGKDRGYLLVVTDGPLSRSAFSSLVQKADFEVCSIQVWEESPGRRLHLVEVEGFVNDDDPRLGRIGATEAIQAWAVGGYAVPLDSSKLAGAPGLPGPAEDAGP